MTEASGAVVSRETCRRAAAIAARLRAAGSELNRKGMARFGIDSIHAAGVSMVAVRRIARETGTDTALARALWATELHEARILAGLIADPEAIDRAEMERWLLAVRSWDLCDQLCMNLFRKSALAWQLARGWTNRPEEFVKRAGFSLIATLTVHGPDVPDDRFRGLLPLIERRGADERTCVKKAASWALREIGKRRPALRSAVCTAAARMGAAGSRAGRWIASDVLRELSRMPAPRPRP